MELLTNIKDAGKTPVPITSMEVAGSTDNQIKVERISRIAEGESGETTMQVDSHQHGQLPEEGGHVNTIADVDTANDFAEITLYDNGIIKSCSRACADLLGCAANSLTMHHISKILPQLAEVVLIKGDRVNPYLRFLSRAGHHFEVVAVTGSHFLCALFFNDIEDFGKHRMRIIFRPVPTYQ